MASSESRFAVVSAMVGNTVVAMAKFVAFAMTGSGSILSEAIHSVADVMNQALLYLGVIKSSKSADSTYQYGYGRERFVWSLMSAVGIFFLGCGVSLYHGVHSVLHPKEATGIAWAVGVLIFALVVEALILFLAARALWSLKGERSFLDYLKTDADPPAVAVLLEDAAACVGVLIALACISLSHWTGDPRWDALGSILIGLLLGWVAIWLIARNRELLLGRAIPKEAEAKIKAYLSTQPSIAEVMSLKSDMIDTETYDLQLGLRFNSGYLADLNQGSVKLAWNKGLKTEADLDAFARQHTDDVVRTLGREVDRIEIDIQALVPRLKHIDIEPELAPAHSLTSDGDQLSDDSKFE
ncbi:MAG: cation diffusion facilitator family transporter [Myxococcota bacterium]|nr:cation diffusion facilitator family transporter [Myxococcota bacterium]